MDVPIRVVIVDDHEMVLQSLCSCLEQHPSIQVVGTARSSDEVEQLVCETNPHVVLMDLQLPGRGAFDAVWVGILSEAIERDLANPGPNSTNFAEGSTAGKFFGDMFMWRRDNDFRLAALSSPAAEIAASLMRSERVDFFYDQLFVKEPGTAHPTPWHQDQPYWPVTGRQISSVWIALDDIDHSNGAVEFIAGSHLWGINYRPTPFRKDHETRFTSSDLVQIPDIDAEPSPSELPARLPPEPRKRAKPSRRQAAKDESLKKPETKPMSKSFTCFNDLATEVAPPDDGTRSTVLGTLLARPAAGRGCRRRLFHSRRFRCVALHAGLAALAGTGRLRCDFCIHVMARAA